MSHFEIHDTCLTAADVLAKARAVHQRRIASRIPRPIPIREIRSVNPVVESSNVTLHFTVAAASPAAHPTPQPLDPSLCFALLICILNALIRTIEMDTGKSVAITDVQRVVAAYYGVSRGDILSRRRTQNVVRPRQVAMYLAKVITLRSLPEIGRMFGGKDHTTVLHAVRKIGAKVLFDPELAHDIAAIKAELGAIDQP